MGGDESAECIPGRVLSGRHCDDPEEDDQGQVPFRQFAPVGQAAHRRTLVVGDEVVANDLVEGAILLEPQALGRKLEIENSGDGFHVSGLLKGAGFAPPSNLDIEIVAARHVAA